MGGSNGTHSECVREGVCLYLCVNFSRYIYIEPQTHCPISETASISKMFASRSLIALTFLAVSSHYASAKLSCTSTGYAAALAVGQGAYEVKNNQPLAAEGKVVEPIDNTLVLVDKEDFGSFFFTGCDAPALGIEYETDDGFNG